MSENKNNRLYMIAVVWALMYPTMLLMFGSYTLLYNSEPSFSTTAKATFFMVMMAALPLVALWAVSQMKRSDDQKAVSKRVLLYILVATPPAYILVGTIASLFGFGALQPIIWMAIILMWFFIVQVGKFKPSVKEKSLLNYNLVRKVHRVSAFLLIFGFIGLHIMNHGVALISLELHEKLRLLFRSWYASTLVEPMLFGLLLIMIFSGVPMALRYMRSVGDHYKTLQIGSGIYMAFFFMAHVNAVLSARYRGVETDWIFATGEQGLINGYYFLIPYYIWSVGMIWLHVSCGIRMVMLANKVSAEKASQTFKVLIFVGSLVAIIITAAILGF